MLGPFVRADYIYASLNHSVREGWVLSLGLDGKAARWYESLALLLLHAMKDSSTVIRFY